MCLCWNQVETSHHTLPSVRTLPKFHSGQPCRDSLFGSTSSIMLTLSKKSKAFSKSSFCRKCYCFSAATKNYVKSILPDPSVSSDLKIDEIYASSTESSNFLYAYRNSSISMHPLLFLSMLIKTAARFLLLFWQIDVDARYVKIIATNLSLNWNFSIFYNTSGPMIWDRWPSLIHGELSASLAVILNFLFFSNNFWINLFASIDTLFHTLSTLRKDYLGMTEDWTESYCRLPS